MNSPGKPVWARAGVGFVENRPMLSLLCIGHRPMAGATRSSGDAPPWQYLRKQAAIRAAKETSPNHLSESEDNYNAKWAATFRLNKQIFDAAISAASNNDDRAFRNSLFVLGFTVAHELVHLLVGFIYGYSRLNTPPPVNEPPGSAIAGYGEAGRKWEQEHFGHIITHYGDPTKPKGPGQAGIFYATVGPSLGLEVDTQWIDRMISLDFSQGVVTLRTPNGRSINLGKPRWPMEDQRKPVHRKDFRSALDAVFRMMNDMAAYHLDHAALVNIMGMATDRRNVRPPTAT